MPPLTTLIGGLVAIAKAIPALAGLCNYLISTIEKLDKAKNEAAAQARKARKDADVDRAFDGDGVLPPKA